MTKPPTRIDPEQVGRFSIDDENRLYWDGKVLQTAVSLTPKQNLWAVIISVATVLAALATIANASANVYVVFLKKAPAEAERRESAPKSAPAATVPSKGAAPGRTTAPPGKQ